ncbi:TPA: prepilin-type N-terminal cleavage/methylation domain-containing protein [Aeromonas sobria]|nr:prepilin-type N-terminal cleavage/methylation domain-containing protein [Aeromonas sobria]
MKKQAGFTLIELVIVIIILGILAVTAAPKFLNLQDDAKKAAADGVLSAVSSSMQLVYSKAALEGKEKGTDNTIQSSSGEDIKIAFGYPTAADDGISKSLTLDGGWDSDVLEKDVTYQFYNVGKDGKAVETSPCVIYTQAKDEKTPATTAAGKVSGGKCQ